MRVYVQLFDGTEPISDRTGVEVTKTQTDETVTYATKETRVKRIKAGTITGVRYSAKDSDWIVEVPPSHKMNLDPTAECYLAPSPILRVSTPERLQQVQRLVRAIEEG